MSARVTVLGGGHGSAAVIQALREEAHELTVIVTTADDGGSSGELRRTSGGPAVGDLRRALIALSGGDVPLARAFAEPLGVRPVGPHPLGNLVIRSVAQAFGDLEAASDWLAGRLGASGRVLPATLEPVSLVAEAGHGLIRGESAIGGACATIRRLRFEPPQPQISSRSVPRSPTRTGSCSDPGRCSPASSRSAPYRTSRRPLRSRRRRWSGSATSPRSLARPRA